MKPYDQIRNQLQAFESDIDKENLWANTAHAIPKKRRPMGLIILLLFGSVLIGGGIGVISLNRAESARQVSTKTVVPSATVHDAVVNAPQTTTNPQHQTSERDNNLKFVNAVSSPVQPQDGSPDVQPGEISKTNHVIVNTPAEISAVEVATGTSIGNVLSIDLQEGAGNDNLLYPDMKNEALGSGTMQSYTVVKNADVLSISPLAISDQPIVLFSESKPLTKKRKSKKPFNLYLSQSIGMTSMTIDAGSADLESRKDFLTGRMESLENLSTRFGATMDITHRWKVGTGLQWNQLTTKTDFSWTEEARISGEGVSTVIIDADGSQHFQSGVVGINRVSQWEAQRYTTHRSLCIEAQIAYQVFHIRRFELVAGLHGRYNLLYESKGSVFGKQDQPVLITPRDQYYTLTSPVSVGLSLTGTYQVSRRFGVQLSLQADHFRYQQFIDQSPMQYKHDILALGAGLRYRL